MNTTSAVMKEWRRQQTAAPAAVAVAIPERVQEAMSAALATVWSEAQELANESLTAAKQAWETERADADAMRSELADAYESQAKELDTCKQQLTEAQAENMAAEQQRQEQAQELVETAARLHELERRDQEARQRIEELRAELAQAKTHADQQEQQHRQELAAIREKLEQQSAAHADQLAAVQQQRDTTAQELATVKARAEAQQGEAGAAERRPGSGRTVGRRAGKSPPERSRSPRAGRRAGRSVGSDNRTEQGADGRDSEGAAREEGRRAQEAHHGQERCRPGGRLTPFPFGVKKPGMARLWFGVSPVHWISRLAVPCRCFPAVLLPLELPPVGVPLPCYRTT